MTAPALNSRPTTAGLVAVTLATATMLALALHNVLWMQAAGSPMLLDEGERVATLAWIFGWWVLMPWAVGAALFLLVLVVRRSARRRRVELGDGAAFALSAMLLVGALLFAPLSGSGSATASAPPAAGLASPADAVSDAESGPSGHT